MPQHASRPTGAHPGEHAPPPTPPRPDAVNGPALGVDVERSWRRALRARVRGEVRFDDGDRALYSTDASNYRQIPIGVVLPRDADDVRRDGRGLPRVRRADRRRAAAAPTSPARRAMSPSSST